MVIPASVPGCVHTDLLAAGLIDDPYIADNELGLLWTGRCDWSYAREFSVSERDLEHGHVDLCFDGLDTIATILVNDVEVGRTRNMHRRYRFDIGTHVTPGVNQLEVRFAAPVPHAFDQREKLGDLPVAGGGLNPTSPHNMLRKMSCNMGWDWGPVLPTCGIWRSVRLETWSKARLGDVRPIIREATAERAVIDIDADIEGDVTLLATLTAPDGTAFDATDRTIVVDKPALWFPIGYGPQPRYELALKLRDEDGQILDTRGMLIGLRSVELESDPDTDPPTPADDLGRGSTMRLRVNGEVVYCKGADWIPDDCFPHRVDEQRYRRRLEQAASAHMNMLRVWGGGLFEDDAFYDVCDELGILVWQDFLTACASYHEDDESAAEMEAEARDNVSRLMRHPSVVMLNGCNENLWAYKDWKYNGVPWHEHIGDRGWGLKYYFETFPAVMAELAPTTPYWPASPCNGPTLADFENGDPNANEHGNRHVWNVWHGPGHYLNYFGHWPRFCSEFGFHGPANWPTLERAIPADQRAWDSPTMRLHNKNSRSEIGDGQDKATARMADDFDVPTDFDDWLYLAQVMQARALQIGVGWFRSLYPWNNGALIWQLNDCWPCSSWAMIDGDGRAKPILHAARRFFAPRVVNLGPRRPTAIGGWDQDPGPLRAYLHNDHAEAWSAILRLRQMNYAGQTLAEHTQSVTIPPRAAANVNMPDGWSHDPATFMVAEAEGGERSFWWFTPDKHAPIPSPAFDTEVDGLSVTVRAKTLLRDVCLFVDRLDPNAVASDACVTLLPGESFTFRVDGIDSLDIDAVKRPPVMRVIGDLLRPE
ncbi:MAG: glycoside hydrolase family 2 protein [Planctomycetota bacterium]